MTLDEARRIAGQLPPVIPIETAGALAGMSRGSSYEAAARGELPVLAFGRRRVVVTAKWLAMLGISEKRDGSAPAGAPVDQLVSAAPAEDQDGS
jgi:hypothetical protein